MVLVIWCRSVYLASNCGETSFGRGFNLQHILRRDMGFFVWWHSLFFTKSLYCVKNPQKILNCNVVLKGSQRMSNICEGKYYVFEGDLLMIVEPLHKEDQVIT